MCFPELFINAKILPLNLLYCKILYEVLLPELTYDLFTKRPVSSLHSHITHSSTSENLYIKPSTLEIQNNAFSKIDSKL